MPFALQLEQGEDPSQRSFFERQRVQLWLSIVRRCDDGGELQQDVAVCPAVAAWYLTD